MIHETSLPEALAQIHKQIDDLQLVATTLEAMFGQTQTQTPSPEQSLGRRPRGEIPRAAIEILRAIGRPMHALREILPAIQAQGLVVNRNTLGTAMIRTGQIERVAPGTFALKKEV